MKVCMCECAGLTYCRLKHTHSTHLTNPRSVVRLIGRKRDCGIIYPYSEDLVWRYWVSLARIYLWIIMHTWVKWAFMLACKRENINVDWKTRWREECMVTTSPQDNWLVSSNLTTGILIVVVITNGGSCGCNKTCELCIYFAKVSVCVC